MEKSLQERFDEKYIPVTESGCWIWESALDRHGYGVFRVRPRTVRAYRWAYDQKYGIVPEGLELDHLCRVTFCVNPDHLEAVPHRINIIRGGSPAAAAFRKTSCSHGHSLEIESGNVYLYGPGKRSRMCLTCKNIRRNRKVTR